MQKRLPPATIAALSPPPGGRFPYTFFQDADAAKNRFRPEITAFDLRNAWWLCDAAFLAYSADADVSAAYASAPGAAQVRHFAGRRGTACYVATSDDWMVLAFRGTEVNDFWRTVLDVATDAQVFPVRDERGDLVHGGFLRSVDEVWQAVRAHIAAQQAARRRPLWIAGHSLGAGLAIVAANRCGVDPALGAAGLYVYASPPVGDSGFAARIAIPAFRVANNMDLLTHVPFGPFTPVGTLRFIDGNGHLHPQTPSTLDLLLDAGRLFGGFALSLGTPRLLAALGQAVVVPPPLADHAPVNYATRLWNAHDDE